MDVDFEFCDRKLILRATPSDQDIAFGADRKAKIAALEVYFALPDGFSKYSIHPDALCLLALLIYGPFAKGEFNTSWGVSRVFSDVVGSFFKRKINNVDDHLHPRSLPDFGREALAFSGGVDSVAALALLPDDTLPIFMKRALPDASKHGLYRPDAALKSCQSLRDSGRDVAIIETTMEFARDPVGFSVDWTNAAGAVLFSDFQNLRSVSFGMVQESAFFLGHSHFSDLQRRSVYSAWAPIFACIGLPISLPAAGLSEVVTSMIARNVNYKWVAQSCVRGSADLPCGRCFKCFRKVLLDAKIRKAKVSAEHFLIVQSSAEVRRRVLEVPIHHENVLAYSLNDLQVESSDIYIALSQKTKPLFEYGRGLRFLEKFNTLGLKYVPTHLCDSVRERIGEHAQDADESDRAIIEGWDIENISRSDAYLSAQARLEAILS